MIGSDVANPSITRTTLKVLQNEAILECIFSYFQPEAFFCNPGRMGEIAPQTRRALLFACLTCKSFVQPALNLLWRRMTSITPVLKILPAFVRVNNVYTLVDGEFQQAHIERFEMYTQKIRVLCIATFPDTIADHCIHRLLNTPNLVVFPALKHLHLPHLSGHRPAASVQNLSPLFLTPGSLLSSVRIQSIDSQNRSLVSSLFEHLCRKAPGLDGIDLSGEISPEIVKSLKFFKNLWGVWLSPNSNFPISALLQDLCGLPRLSNLRLRLNNIGYITPLFTGEIKGFQALKQLVLEGNPSETVKILESLPEAPGLCDVFLMLPATGYQSSISIQKVVAESCRIAPNMTNFVLNTDGGRAGFYTDIYAFNIFEPFVKCPQITSLRISNVNIALSDDEIRQVSSSRAWRNLRTLHLPPSCFLGRTLSLESLQILAQNCPNLISLEIGIDFNLHIPPLVQGGQWPGFCGIPERRHPRVAHPLQQLAIFSVNEVPPLSNLCITAYTAMTVARFLEHVFPNLSSPRISLRTTTQTSNVWWNIVKSNFAEVRLLRAEVETDTTRRLNK